MTKDLKSKKVLVVEDDPSYSKLWGRLLKTLGLKKYWICPTIEEARVHLQHSKPDFVVSDVILPDGNGYQIAEEVRRENPKVCVLLTTGYKTDLTRFDLKNPSFHLLYKPYQNLEQLKTFLLRLLAGEDPSQDADETSFSENEDYPEITEWTL